jgi:hypothetical protein
MLVLIKLFHLVRIDQYITNENLIKWPTKKILTQFLRCRKDPQHDDHQSIAVGLWLCPCGTTQPTLIL